MCAGLTSALVLTHVGVVSQTLYHYPYGDQALVWAHTEGRPDTLAVPGPSDGPAGYMPPERHAVRSSRRSG